MVVDYCRQCRLVFIFLQFFTRFFSDTRLFSRNCVEHERQNLNFVKKQIVLKPVAKISEFTSNIIWLKYCTHFRNISKMHLRNVSTRIYKLWKKIYKYKYCQHLLTIPVGNTIDEKLKESKVWNFDPSCNQLGPFNLFITSWNKQPAKNNVCINCKFKTIFHRRGGRYIRVRKYFVDNLSLTVPHKVTL